MQACVNAKEPHSYHWTTIYLTKEQRQWLTRLAAQARLEGSTLSASDVIRYALTSVQERLSEAELCEAVIKHVHSEAKLYPGRARRGLPPDSSSQGA
jgi:Arc/MetJ-type ribon-helix-helix transcriptional regulator